MCETSDPLTEWHRRVRRYAGVLAVACASMANAQEHHFSRYSTASGLPGSRVLALAQDDVGYLWMGTSAGLARYDGTGFETVALPEATSGVSIAALVAGRGGVVALTERGAVVRVEGMLARPMLGDGLTDGDLTSLSVDDDGHLWFAGAGRVVSTRGGNPTRVVVSHPELAGRCCASVVRARSGRIWVGATGVVYRVTGDRLIEAFRGLAEPLVARVMLEDAAGTLWVGTDGGLYRSVGDQLEWVRVLGRARVLALTAADNGEIWISTDRGVYRRRGAEIERFDARNGTGDGPVHAALVDREGTVWFGTDSGVMKFVATPFVVYSRDSGLPNSFVVDVDVDDANTVWVAVRSGVVSIGADGAIVDRIRIDDGVGTRVTRLLLDGSTVWVGTTSGLLVGARDGAQPRLIGGPEVTGLARFSGSLWVASGTTLSRWNSGALQPVDLPVALRGARLVSLAASGDTLWIGTDSRGVWRMTADGTTTAAHGEDGDVEVLGLAAADGGVWAATNGFGAIRYRDGAAPLRLTRAGNGLASDFVQQVLTASDGGLWLYTNWGLDRWDPERGITHYGVGDGLPAAAGTRDAAARTADGRVWFGTPEGLAVFRPDFVASEQAAPVAVIRSVEAGGAPADARVLSSLPPERNAVTIGFSALSFRDEAGTRFQHRLIGHNDVWSRPSLERTVSYVDLRPGSYVFEVQAISESGRWSDAAARLEFTVLPAPWQTTWFRGSIAALLAVLVALLFRRRLRQVDGERQRLRRIVDKRTRELVEKNALLERMATTDELTALPNRRFFLESLEREVRKLTRIGVDQELAVLVIDLDRFKSINDDYGHAAGDEVLRHVARQLRDGVRATDLPARYGGEEFAILLPNTDVAGARFLAEKLRTDVGALRVEAEGHRIQVTISVGVAAMGAPERFRPEAQDELLRRADEAMYEAKEGGRDRVCVAVEATAC